MSPNQKGPKNSRRSPKNARAFDILPAPRTHKPAFPDVGMTLQSYAPPKSRTSRAKGSPAVSRPSKPKARFITKKRIILAFVTLLLVVFGWLGVKFGYNLFQIFGGGVFNVLSLDKLDGEDEGRVNILLAGNSADDPGHNGADLTDSIMIISIGTDTKSAFMLSIPRDLYVESPAGSYKKINAVFPYGENNNFNESGYPEGGMGQLQKVLEQRLDIDIHYHALINYTALRDAVDSVGGVEFTVDTDSACGLYDPNIDYTTGGPLVDLDNGTHVLNGQEALNLARARGSSSRSCGFAGSDFTRAENQRQLVLALRQKATSAGVLTNPVKIGGLFDSIGGNVSTDMDLGNVRRLYEITKDIPGSAIRSVSLNNADGQNLLSSYRTFSGASALVPAAGLDDYSQIQRYVSRLTTRNPLIQENATIVVLNGTNTYGLAAEQRARLEKQQLTVTEVADASDDTHDRTKIIDLSGGKAPKTLQKLQSIYNGARTLQSNTTERQYDAMFIVVLGDRVTNSTSVN